MNNLNNCDRSALVGMSTVCDPVGKHISDIVYDILFVEFPYERCLMSTCLTCFSADESCVVLTLVLHLSQSSAHIHNSLQDATV